MLMAFMKPTTVVIQVGSMSLQWHELQPLIRQFIDPNQNKSSEESSKILRTLMQRIALRGLYLHEANARNIQVSEEQRRANEQQLEQGLQGNSRGATTEDVKKALAAGKSTLLSLSEEDAQRVVTLGNQLLAEITITDGEVDQQLLAMKAVRDSMQKQNESIKQFALGLLQKPEALTDQGFAYLAKEYSDGVEAKQGGVLNYDFTRSELATVNHIEQFELQVGQTSPLYETPTAFRVMRVLSRVAPEKEGDAEKLRAAQWLFRKMPVADEKSRDDLRAQLLVSKQKNAVAAIGQSLAKKYPVSCVFSQVAFGQKR
ncbi:peptidylprolyl isomerase [Oligosphaera ethanolica]|uniref:PpiC domain-containing protein n=1 Tax=Oligosphaera ethanolica TaxID=760260 RepID=A0AAE3VDC9_9BACT|nr:peptidylprolyl isomerase [Oligosphaera ethanolica]MDQ0288442.1 hypothetical protein [Oligosphaera ethanolica]